MEGKTTVFRVASRNFWRVLLGLGFIVLLETNPVVAQITKLTDRTAFSDQAIALHFTDLPVTGDVSDVYSKVGVTFAGEGGSVPTALEVVLVSSFAPTIDDVIRNVPATGSSADLALILRFARPLRRVGFTLGNGSASTLAEIEAFTAGGDFLGRIQQGAIQPLVGPFVGLETAHPAGISTVVLDYGKDQAAEQIADLLMDFLSPRTFKTYLPQIVHGRAGSISFQTQIQIQSLFRSTTQVRMKLFDQAGAPLPMLLDGRRDSVFDFTFTSSGMRQLQTEGSTEGLTVGYASIESNLPVAAHAVFKVSSSDGSSLSETGIAAAEAQGVRVASVEREPGADLDTAIAIVNVDGAETAVYFILTDETGQPPRDFGDQRLELRPGEHRAFFLSQLFVGLSDTKFYTRFRGRLVIRSAKPTALITLRTIGGLPASTMAVGSTQD